MKNTLRISISLMLVFLMLFSVFPGSFNKKVCATDEYVRVYDSFTLGTKTANLGAPSVDDWTKYNTLIIRATNEKKTERAYDVNVYSENPATTGPDYYQFFIQADWEGTKEFAFDIRDGGGFFTSRTPLGWNNITGVIISTTGSALQQKWGVISDNDTEIQVEGIYLTNRDYSYLFTDTAKDYLIESKLDYIFDPDSGEKYTDYASKIRERAASHPRILFNGEELGTIKSLIKTDSYVNATVNKIKREVDGYVEYGPITKPDSTEPFKMVSAALLYNLVPEQQYADFVWRSMLNITRFEKNWNNANHSSLSHGDTMRAVAYTYDWMYNHWTESQRRIVRNAMVHFGIELSIPYLRPYKQYWGGKGGNWCQIILSGTCLTALAICDDPKYDDLVNEVVNRCIVGLSFTHDQSVDSDGSYMEGVSYWGYGMGNYLPFLAALYDTTGNDELMKLPGMDKTGMFPIGMTGPKGFYNFGDGSSSTAVTAGGYFFLSRYFDDPAYGAYQKKYTSSGGDYRALALYRPDERYKEFEKYMPDFNHFPGKNDVFTIRRSWTDNNKAFLGVKAGTNGASSHGNLDIGSFVFDLMGVRWAHELGRDTYDGAYLYQDGKYAFYRNRAEGQNTLVINPDGSIDQNTQASCKIDEYNVTDKGAYVTMDITDAYKDKGVSSVKRGYALLNNYNSLLIQDEIISSSTVEVYSFVHTMAELQISSDKKSAVFTQDGKKLRARLLSPANGAFISMAADPLPLSPNPPEAWDRNGYRKLALHVENVQSPTIAMLLTPYSEDEEAEYTLDTLKKVDDFGNYISDYRIKGDSYLLRATEGAFSVNRYELLADNEGEITEVNAIWSIETPHEGVSVPDSSKGDVVVSGNAQPGIFKLTARDEYGKLIATKNIKLVGDISHASQPTLTQARYADDFEEKGKTTKKYIPDETFKYDSGYWYSPFCLRTHNINPAYVRREENGNTYVSATGLLDFTTNGYETGTNGNISSGLRYGIFTSSVTDSAGNPLYWTMDMASRYTLEVDLMAESKYTRSADRAWTLFANGGNGKNLDIRYRQEKDGIISIYLVTKNENKKDVFNLIAEKEADKWFNFRVEFDTEIKTITVYLDNEVVIDSMLYENYSAETGMFGIAADNLSVYTGEKCFGTDVSVFANGQKLSEGATSYVWTTDIADALASATVTSEANDIENGCLIVACYNKNGKLVGIDCATTTKNEVGIYNAMAEVKASVSKDDYFKVFLWDVHEIKPINVED